MLEEKLIKATELINKTMEDFNTAIAALPEPAEDEHGENDTGESKALTKILEKHDKAMEKANANLAKVASEVTSKVYTQEELDNLLEKEVVKIAKSMGIKASVRDLKADTIAKVLEAGPVWDS